MTKWPQLRRSWQHWFVEFVYAKYWKPYETDKKVKHIGE